MYKQKYEEHELIKDLKNKCNKVYIWKDNPNKFYKAHKHPYNTKLIMIKENMKINLKNKKLNLKKGSKIIIGANEEHEVEIGHNGCTYIVAEKLK